MGVFEYQSGNHAQNVPTVAQKNVRKSGADATADDEYNCRRRNMDAALVKVRRLSVTRDKAISPLIRTSRSKRSNP